MPPVAFPQELDCHFLTRLSQTARKRAEELDARRMEAVPLYLAGKSFADDDEEVAATAAAVFAAPAATTAATTTTTATSGSSTGESGSQGAAEGAGSSTDASASSSSSSNAAAPAPSKAPKGNPFEGATPAEIDAIVARWKAERGHTDAQAAGAKWRAAAVAAAEEDPFEVGLSRMIGVLHLLVFRCHGSWGQ